MQSTLPNIILNFLQLSLFCQRRFQSYEDISCGPKKCWGRLSVLDLLIVQITLGIGSKLNSTTSWPID